MKDSGARAEFDSGMVRDTEDGKLDYTLILDGPMLKRWAAHLTKGAKKYAPRNWMKAAGPAEYARFKRSFLRHAMAYLDGEVDEDHAAAMIFNINGMEYVKEQTKSVLGPTAGEAYTTRHGSPMTGCQKVCLSCDERLPHCHTGLCDG